jgi:hypothetical protein
MSSAPSLAPLAKVIFLAMSSRTFAGEGDFSNDVVAHFRWRRWRR